MLILISMTLALGACSRSEVQTTVNRDVDLELEQLTKHFGEVAPLIDRMREDIDLKKDKMAEDQEQYGRWYFWTQIAVAATGLLATLLIGLNAINAKWNLALWAIVPTALGTFIAAAASIKDVNNGFIRSVQTKEKLSGLQSAFDFKLRMAIALKTTNEIDDDYIGKVQVLFTEISQENISSYTGSLATRLATSTATGTPAPTLPDDPLPQNGGEH